MKKIVYNIVAILAATCFFASCEKDNYVNPTSGIKGRFIDAETSELIPMPVPGTSSIQIRMYERDRYYSTGSDYSRLPVISYPRIDGTYENAWMFDKPYILTLEQTNFYPVDTIVVNLNANGLTEQDIKVVPYARIKVNSAAFADKKLKVSYTVTRSRNDYKIENAFLAWHISPYIDKMSGNSEQISTVDYSQVADNSILGTTLTQEIDLTDNASFNNKDKQAIMKGNGNKLYIRVGVTTNGKLNFSEVVSVNVTF